MIKSSSNFATPKDVAAPGAATQSAVGTQSGDAQDRSTDSLAARDTVRLPGVGGAGAGLPGLFEVEVAAQLRHPGECAPAVAHQLKARALSQARLQRLQFFRWATVRSAAPNNSFTAAPSTTRSSSICTEVSTRAEFLVGVMSPNPTVEKTVTVK